MGFILTPGTQAEVMYLCLIGQTWNNKFLYGLKWPVGFTAKARY